MHIVPVGSEGEGREKHGIRRRRAAPVNGGGGHAVPVRGGGEACRSEGGEEGDVLHREEVRCARHREEGTRCRSGPRGEGRETCGIRRRHDVLFRGSTLCGSE